MRKLLFILLLAASCGRQSRNEGAEVISLNATEFNGRRSDQSILLDVRTPQEFQRGYIEGAVNLDFNADDFEVRLDSLDRSKEYMLYCAKGARSDKAAVKMKEMGFTSIATLEGGLNAWTAEGLPVKSK